MKLAEMAEVLADVRDTFRLLDFCLTAAVP